MREVEVSRFIRATEPELERRLSPASIVEYEGSFAVRDVTELEEGTRVIAGARGLEIGLFFEEREDGYVYRQEGQAGPFDEMETTLTYDREDEGVRVRMRSAVSLGLFPRRLTDRVAAWKRKGELERALDRLADDLE